MTADRLPIDPFVDVIVAHVRRARAVVVTAQPGAGKTTRVPPALTEDGPVILLQPRRVAARTIAARIASERGWTLGREVGWQVRFERQFAADTALLVVTEGILTARMQDDPLLSAFRTVVLDEFHERSIHADLAIALARQAWLARDDLRLVVMSATMDAARVAAFLDGCPIVDVPGRVHPVDVSYSPGESMDDAAVRIGAAAAGVLCFLPGAREIRRAIETVAGRVPAEVLPLHGSLSAEEQARAIAPVTGRRIVFATNIAETSITVPGITAVIDSGAHKVARYDPERGIDSLVVERITADSAEQRAGRAGRVAPGIAVRLWDPRDRLRPHREPDVRRIDLSSALLDVIAWGAEPRTFGWFEPPPDEQIDAAMELLARLGLVAGRTLTPLGARVHQLPVHPRLARILVEADGAPELARACAVIAERNVVPPRGLATSSDLLAALDRWHLMPPDVQRLARQLQVLAAPSSARRRPDPAIRDERQFRRAIFSGYPDRIAQRRAPRSPNLVLASGTGAVLGDESGVFEGEFLAAIDVRTAAGGPRVRIASLVDREWLQPTRSEIEHRFDSAGGRVRASEVTWYDALVLADTPVPPDPDVAARLLAAAWRDRGADEPDTQLIRRLRFAGLDADVDALVEQAVRGARTLDDVRLARALSPDVTRLLDREAPGTLVVPSGRTVRLHYEEDGTVSAAVKLQELFGLAETPRIGRSHAPLVLSLLAPNSRPVQVTSDLGSFWRRTYPEVRKELRGRYPRHPWPEDPWTATPTARAKKPGQ